MPIGRQLFHRMLSSKEGGLHNISNSHSSTNSDAHSNAYSATDTIGIMPGG